MSVLLLNVAFKTLFYLSLSVCCSITSVSPPSLSYTLLISVFVLSQSVCLSVCLSNSNSQSLFRCSGKNIDYWPVQFWILTDSYLIVYHFILTHLPASQVAGAIDPLWLSQRNHWSSAMQPLPLCFAYRIHKQTYKDAIEVKESSQSELTHWHARTHTQTHVGVASCNIWDSSNVLLKKVSRQPHQ